MSTNRVPTDLMVRYMRALAHAHLHEGADIRGQIAFGSYSQSLHMSEVMLQFIEDFEEDVGYSLEEYLGKSHRIGERPADGTIDQIDWDEMMVQFVADWLDEEANALSYLSTDGVL